MGGERSNRGRPRLKIEMDSVLEAVLRHGQITAAARELGCSPAYIHAALNRAGITLADVLGIKSR